MAVSKSGLFVGLVLLAGAAAAGLYASGAAGPAKAADEKTQPPPPVPVTVATATQGDVPVYLRGIGTVQAFNAVEVKAQVNGVLVNVPAHEGDEVKKGTLLAVVDPRPYQATLDAAMAKRDQDQAQLQNAQLDLKRYQSLATQSFASRQQVDTQQASVNSSQAGIAGDTAAIEAAQLNLGFCYITAPIDGRVSLRQVDVGNLITAASQATGIFSITQDHPISVVFTLPEGDLPRVEAAMHDAKLPVFADTSNGQTQLAEGTLLTPNNAVDDTTGTIQLKATFDNPDNKLWPGQFVNARLLVDTIRGAVTVPHLAVQHGQAGLFVFLVKPDNTAAQAPITVTYDDGQRAVVTKGVVAGQAVVIAGQSRLGNGTHVATNSPDHSS